MTAPTPLADLLQTPPTRPRPAGTIAAATTAEARPVAVVIVAHETRELLSRCLASVECESPAELVVVETGTKDGSAAMVAAEFPHARLLHEPSNPGYGTAANRAIAATRQPYVLLLNGDTRVLPGALQALASHLDRHPRAAVVGPRLEYPDGALQPSCFPFLGTPRLAFEKSPLARLARAVPFVRERWLLSGSAHDRARVVPWVLGAALAIRREAWSEVGGFDESFFLFAEEVDLCYRLGRAGWQVHFAPVATVVHVAGASTTVRPQHATRLRVEGARRFYRRHYPRWRWRVLDLSIRGAFLARLVRDAARRAATSDPLRRARLDRALGTWRGVLADLRSQPS